MERRSVLAGLLTGAAGTAWAGAAAVAQSVPDMAAGLSEAARAHLRDTLAAGALSLAISRIALGKLKHPMTRQFADFEVAEQTTLADVLKARTMPGPSSSGEAAGSDADVDAGLDAPGRDVVERFRALKEGLEFEKAYVVAEIDGHRQSLAIQDAYLKVADDPGETAIAKLARATIAEHLTLLADTARHLG